MHPAPCSLPCRQLRKSEQEVYELLACSLPCRQLRKLSGIRIVSDNNAEYPEERLTAQDVIDQKFEIIGWAWSWQTMETW